jgi:hypothetical protein
VHSSGEPPLNLFYYQNTHKDRGFFKLLLNLNDSFVKKFTASHIFGKRSRLKPEILRAPGCQGWCFHLPTSDLVLIIGAGLKSEILRAPGGRGWCFHLPTSELVLIIGAGLKSEILWAPGGWGFFGKMLFFRLFSNV